MPYIKPYYRGMLSEDLDQIITNLNKNDIFKENKAGFLNYIFTKLIKGTYDEINYHNLNEIIGILECCKIELYRKIAAPYEDIKEKENGEVI